MNATPSVAAYIALGSNLEQPLNQVRDALDALTCLPLSKRVACSSLYRTTPVGYLGQPDFINAVACIRTQLAPRMLLDVLLAIEVAHGRVRDFVNAPRTLDLDIVLYGDLRLHEPGLTVPHPRLHERAFVLAPLAEIAPDAIIPGRGAVRDLLCMLDAGGVERLPAACTA